MSRISSTKTSLFLCGEKPKGYKKQKYKKTNAMCDHSNSLLNVGDNSD